MNLSIAASNLASQSVGGGVNASEVMLIAPSID